MAPVDRKRRWRFSAGNAGFNVLATVGSYMQCHYCDDDAAYAAESDGIKVGLCEEHFRDRLEELAEADTLEQIRERVDVDRRE